MIIAMNHALKCKTQRKIILTIYQNEKQLCNKDLAEIIQTSQSNIHPSIKTLKEKGILNCNIKGKRQFLYLTQGAIKYLVKHHPEITPKGMNLEILEKENKKYRYSIMPEESFNNTVDVDQELREYYIKAIELLKSQNYMSLLINHSLKEAILLSLLIICYFENKNINFNDIASFMGISEMEVIIAYQKVLIMLKDSVNEFIDNMVNNLPNITQENNTTKLQN